MNVFGTIEVEGLNLRAVHQTGLAGGHDVAIMLGDEIIASASISKISRSRSLKIKPGTAAAKTIPMADATPEAAAPVAEEKTPVVEEKVSETFAEAKGAKAKAAEPSPEPEPVDEEELHVDEDDLI